jgi:SAM-dependent methyltransferase
MYILGLSAYSRDSAAALVHDGRVLAAAQEECFTRQERDSRFPVRAVDHCLREAGIRVDQLDFIGFFEKPMIRFERDLETYLAYAPAGFDSFRRSLPVWLGQLLRMSREINARLGLDPSRRHVFPFHHESHAASAFFPSPFEEAAILVVDGFGDRATTTLGHGRGHRIELEQELRFPHSLGLVCSAFAEYLGLGAHGGERELRRLASHGVPKHETLVLERLMDLGQDGSLWLDLSYFHYAPGLPLTTARFHELFGRPPRGEDDPLEPLHLDLAASVQAVIGEAMSRMARHAQAATGSRHLCLAGDLAHNVPAIERLERERIFEDIWVQPAPGDAGGALGVALFIWHQLLDNPRTAVRPDDQSGSLLGPAYTSEAITTLGTCGDSLLERGSEPQGEAAAEAAPESDLLLRELWRCPACGGSLNAGGDAVACAACERTYDHDDGIWQLFWPHTPFKGDVTDVVKAFYEETPFPHYEPDETVGSLSRKARRGIYARLLGEQMPNDSRVLEIGCGTGQLTNFLGMGRRSVFGTDLCMNSLRLAEGFRRRHGLARVRFLQMNLFRPAFAQESFDVVLCNGVLHHTSEPRQGFATIARLVKPGGHIVIGLYNTYGRLLLDARRWLFRLTGNFVVLTPMGLMRRRASSAYLRLRKPAGGSYWMPCEQRRDPSTYYRQG